MRNIRTRFKSRVCGDVICKVSNSPSSSRFIPIFRGLRCLNDTPVDPASRSATNAFESPHVLHCGRILVWVELFYKRYLNWSFWWGNLTATHAWMLTSGALLPVGPGLLRMLAPTMGSFSRCRQSSWPRQPVSWLRGRDPVDLPTLLQYFQYPPKRSGVQTKYHMCHCGKLPSFFARLRSPVKSFYLWLHSPCHPQLDSGLSLPWPEAVGAQLPSSSRRRRWSKSSTSLEGLGSKRRQRSQAAHRHWHLPFIGSISMTYFISRWLDPVPQYQMNTHPCKQSWTMTWDAVNSLVRYG